MAALGGRLRQPKATMKRFRLFAKSFISVCLISLLLATKVLALEVPVSQTQQMVDGQQTLTKVFEVDPAIDPSTLVEGDFIQNNFHYTITSIVKDEIMVEDEKEVTQEYEVSISGSDENAARLEALMSMPAFIEYDQEGFTGKLYPVVNSMEGKEIGRTQHSGRKTITKTYTYNYNDDSLIPTTSSGYTLSSISWAEGSYRDNTAIPDNYVATATYSKPYSYSTVDGWTFTMTYMGDVEYESADMIRYTLVYTGVEVEEPGFLAKVFGAESPKPGPIATGADSTQRGPSSQKGRAGNTVLGIICLLIAAAVLGLGGYVSVKFLMYNRVTIYAKDELTGEFNPMKKVWFNNQTATISIDTLAAPATQHFRVALKAKLAESLKNKVVTVKAAQHVFKYTIGPASGVDYVIDVNLDA